MKYLLRYLLTHQERNFRKQKSNDCRKIVLGFRENPAAVSHLLWEINIIRFGLIMNDIICVIARMTSAMTSATSATTAAESSTATSTPAG